MKSGAGSLGAGSLGAGSLGAGSLGAGSLGAKSLGAGSLGAGSLGAGSLGAVNLGAGSLDPQSALLSISLQDNSTHEESAPINDNRAQVAPKLTPTELGDSCHGQLPLHSHFGTATSSPIPDSSVLEEFKVSRPTSSSS